MANPTNLPIPANPALSYFKNLIGQWQATGSHPLLPGKVLHGKSVFEWAEGGAFVVLRSEIYQEGFPAGTAIFGSDDATGQYYMLYFDERKVSRMYEVAVQDKVLRWWRNAPGFSQWYSWTFSEDGNTMTGKGELCEDGENWKQDLDITYTRAL